MPADSLRSVASLILVLCFLVPCISAQDDRVRKLDEEGIVFTLPEGWEWQGTMAKNIAIKAPLAIGERDFEISAQMYFFAGQFLGDKVDGLMAESRDKKGFKKRWSFKHNTTFLGNKGATFVSYTKQRGEGATARETVVRRWLFRRYGHLYEWLEESPKEVSAKANALFQKARKGLKFGKPANPVVTNPKRDYINQRVVYKLPKDWNWVQGKKGSKVRINPKGEKQADGKVGFNHLFTVRTDAFVKESRVAIYCYLLALESPGRPKGQADLMEQGLSKQWNGVKDYELKEKVPIAGRKAHVLQFTGFRKDDKRQTRRFFVRQYVFRHKSQLMIWSEQVSPAKGGSFDKRLKVARKGLKPY